MMQEAGLSIFDLLSVVIVLIALPLDAFLVVTTMKNYKETENKAFLYISTAFIFIFVGGALLIVEKIGFIMYLPLGIVGILIALPASGMGHFFFNVFAFEHTFPEKRKILISVVGTLVLLYLGVLLAAIIVGAPFSWVADAEMIYAPIVDVFAFSFLIPVLFSAPLVFFYFAIKSKEKPKRIRSTLMGLAIALFNIAYIFEAIPIDPLLAVIFRSFFITSAIILYICFSMPDWFKKAIGMEN